MIIELSYWHMFCIGFIVGCTLCWYILVLLNIQTPNKNNKQAKTNYLKPAEFKYQPTNYFKHVPVGYENDCEIGECMTCLKLFPREKSGKGASHCNRCVKASKVRSNPAPLPEYNSNK